MNDTKLFDMIVHMCDSETAGSDYKFTDKSGKVRNLNSSKQLKVANKAIQAFVHKVAKQSPTKKDAHIQAFFGSSDLPVVTKDVFNVTNQIPNFDLYWQEAFKSIKLRKGQLEWEIDTISNAITFELIPEGGKVKFHKFEGTQVTVKVYKYGAGLAITWETIEGRKLYKFVQQMEAMRAALYTLWADTHYGLLATAGATNQITWQGLSTQSTLDRDIQTINKGYEDLGEACKDSGYGEVANVRMLLYASPKLKARIMQALRATSRGETAASSGLAATAGDSGLVVEYNVDPRFTWNSNVPANKALLVLPGNKIQNAVYLQELGLDKKEIESLNELKTYWTAFGAVVADNDQVYELAFA